MRSETGTNAVGEQLMKDDYKHQRYQQTHSQKEDEEDDGKALKFEDAIGSSSPKFRKDVSQYEHVVLVKPLHVHANSKDLMQAFTNDFGMPKRAKVIRDPVSKRSRKFGFVYIKNSEQLFRVLENDEPLIVKGVPAYVHPIEKRQAAHDDGDNLNDDFTKYDQAREVISKDRRIPQMNSVYLGQLPPDLTRTRLGSCLNKLNQKAKDYMPRLSHKLDGIQIRLTDPSSDNPSEPEGWSRKLTIRMPYTMEKRIMDHDEDMRSFKDILNNVKPIKKSRYIRRNTGFVIVRLSTPEHAKAFVKAIQDAVKTGFVWPGGDGQYIPTARVTMDRRERFIENPTTTLSQPRVDLVTPASRIEEQPRKKAEWLKPFD